MVVLCQNKALICVRCCSIGRNSKEVTGTGNLTEELTEKLSTKTMFTIGGLPVDEGVVVMWIIMAAIVVFSLLLTSNLKVENPNKKQLFLEICIKKYYNFFYKLLGEKGKVYIPYLMSTGVFIGMSNTFGVIGFKPPTKDINVTIALALISIILIEFAGMRAKGMKGWAKSFTEPVALITPLNILEIFIRPFALCMRLFGNILGAFVLMELIKAVVPVIIPAACSIYFDMFDGLLQAYIFVFLTAIYIGEAVEG